MKLSKYSQELRDADTRAQNNRNLWSELDRKINKVFSFYKGEEHLAAPFGGLFLARATDYEPIKSAKLPPSQHINSVHIFTGHRLLGISIYEDKKKQFKIASEHNAQLWYSQGPSGQVLVLVSPYQSDIGEIQEKEIIIGKYKNPSLISEEIIKKHFNKFFKYCSCTSQHNVNSFLNYVFRQYLIFNDFRHKISYSKKALIIIERIALFLFGAIAVWLAK